MSGKRFFSFSKYLALGIVLVGLLVLVVPASVVTGQTVTTYDPAWQMTTNWYTDSTIAVTAKPITDPYWNWTSDVWNPIIPDNALVPGMTITSLPHSWYMTNLTLDAVPEKVVLVNKDDSTALYFNDDVYAYVNGSMVACGGAASRPDFHFVLPGPLPSGFVMANALYKEPPGTVDWFINGGLNLPPSAFHVGENTVWILLETLDGGRGLAHPVFVVTSSTTLSATADIAPDTLNLKSKGQVITTYIELPAGHDVGQIDISSIRLNGTVPALAKPTAVGDCDKDGIPDLMVKFNRAAVQSILAAGNQVEVAVSGKVAGIDFEGTDTIRVIG